MSSLSLDEDPTDVILTIQAADKSVIEVPYQYAKLSKLIATIHEQDPTSRFLEFSQIPNKQLLDCIGEYFQLRKGLAAPMIAAPIDHAEMEKNTDVLNANYVDHMFATLGIYTFNELINVANYLDIPSLFNLCCAKIAAICRNKTLTELPKILNPENRVFNQS